MKEDYKWRKLFVSTGDFFVNNPDILVKFEDDLYSVFSKDNLGRIAKKLKDKNGYDFPQLLHKELYDLMVSYEIPIMEAETYIHIESAKPDELIYEDEGTIFSMLRGVIPISKIMVKSLNNEQKEKQIQLTDFRVGAGGICKMLYFNNGIKVKEYIMEINKMIYSHLSSDIVLEFNDIDSVDEEYVAYSETVHGFGNVYPKIYFSSNEKIIIKSLQIKSQG